MLWRHRSHSPALSRRHRHRNSPVCVRKITGSADSYTESLHWECPHSEGQDPSDDPRHAGSFAKAFRNLQLLTAAPSEVREVRAPLKVAARKPCQLWGRGVTLVEGEGQGEHWEVLWIFISTSTIYWIVCNWFLNFEKLPLSDSQYLPIYFRSVPGLDLGFVHFHR